jgi:hypothetical protein
VFTLIVVLSILAVVIVVAALLVPGVRRSRGQPRGDVDVIDAEIEAPPPANSPRNPDHG